jgi:hypothetical protein
MSKWMTVIIALFLAIGVMGVLVASAAPDIRLPLLEDETYGGTDPNWLETRASRGLSGPCATVRQSRVKFDASVLASDVTSATLILQGSEFTGPASGIIVGIWATQDDWSTAPISDGAPLSTTGSPMPPPQALLVFPTTPAFVSYINDQRPANGGDGLVSFVTGYVDCPPLAAPLVRNASMENPLNQPPILEVDHQMPPTSIELASFEGQASDSSGPPPGWPLLIWLAPTPTVLALGWLLTRRRMRQQP